MGLTKLYRMKTYDYSKSYLEEEMLEKPDYYLASQAVEKYNKHHNSARRCETGIQTYAMSIISWCA